MANKRLRQSLLSFDVASKKIKHSNGLYMMFLLFKCRTITITCFETFKAALEKCDVIHVTLRGF